MEKVHDGSAIVASLKACAKHKDLRKGKLLHDYAVKKGLLFKDVYVGSSIVNLYAKCGLIKKAQEVFDLITITNIVPWNALISGFVQHGHGETALMCFKRMHSECFFPDAVTLVCILKACSSLLATTKGKELHASILQQQLDKNVFVGTAMVDMYIKFGALLKAREVLDNLPIRSIASWNALLAGYVQHGQNIEAVKCFGQVELEGLSPNAITFVCMLKACSSLESITKGEEIHKRIVKEGLLQKMVIVANAVMDMYIKCSALEKAQKVFSDLVVRDVVSWNILIAGCAQHSHAEEAIEFYDMMQSDGFSPDAFTFVSVVKACCSIGALVKGREVHVEILRKSLLKKNILIGTALVDMYGKSGAVSRAYEVFAELEARDVVSWNALITGYVQYGLGEEALKCYQEMQKEEGQIPNETTFLVILKACGNIGAVDMGREVHQGIQRQGLLEKDVSLGCALVDMYAKCGEIEKAWEVFQELPVENVVSWTALISGCAQFGKNEVIFGLFNRMVNKNIEPNMVTFAAVLNACSHSGLLDEGQMLFHTMSTVYDIIPALEHHSCMVDLFGRAGDLHKAVTLIDTMPVSSYLPSWNTLLGACQKWGNVKLARWAFDHAVELDTKDAEAYICMRNIYVAAAMRQEADKILAMQKENKAWRVDQNFGIMV